MSLVSRFKSNAPAIRDAYPLSDDQLVKVVPSIYAGQPHRSRSDRYTYIPTSDVLTALRGEGFQPFFACQAMPRDGDRMGHAKHMIRLRHVSQLAGSEANEIILLNSHDGSSSFQLLAGMFRFVCQNGMVVGDNIGEVRVRHTGECVREVIEGAYTVLNHFDEVKEQREAMEGITLDERSQRAFAKGALALRYDDSKNHTAPITESQLLRPRRIEDDKPDLWHTFNRVQENMLKGGLNGITRSRRRTRTRPVNSIDNNVRLNRALWILAEELGNQVS